jgi:hypothetical protein
MFSGHAEALEPRTLLAFGPVGPEFRVNSFEVNGQTNPDIAADADGDFVVTWASYRQDGSGSGIYAQRYNAAGAPTGGEFRVNDTTAGGQNFPSVAMDPDGDFVVAWQGYPLDRSSYAVYARRYNAAGVPQGGEILVSSGPQRQGVPSVACDADGNFVVAWQINNEGPGFGFGISVQRFSAAGERVGTSVRANTFVASDQTSPSVASDAYGNFVVAWMSDAQDGSGRGIYAQRYNAAGLPQGGEFRVNTTTANAQGLPSVAADADGDFVVAWQSLFQDGSNYGVYAQRYNAAGAPQGGEFRANTTTVGNQGMPSVAVDADGDFVVAWETNAGVVPDGIYAQRLSATGAPLGTEFQVSTSTGTFFWPSAAMDADGDVAIAWQADLHTPSGVDVFARRFDDATDAAGPVVTEVAADGVRLAPGQVASSARNLTVTFSERLSTLGGAAGNDSVMNRFNWGLGKDGDDVSASIQSVSFSFNAATHKYEAVLALAQPVLTGSYTLVAFDTIHDVAGNPLDGDRNGIPGGTFTFYFGVANGPPTTFGIPSVVVEEDQEDTVISLFHAFSDTTDADAALLFDVTGNTNPGLFSATSIDRAAGTLTLDYAPDANGEAQITVRATDTAGQSVSTTFTVAVLAVNDPPVNRVPAVQVVRPGQTVTFTRDNAIRVSDVDDPSEVVTVTVGAPANLTLKFGDVVGVDVKQTREGMQLTGRIPDVNAAFEGLRVSQVRQQEEQDTLVIVTDDLGSRGLGGPMADADVVQIVFANAPVLLTVDDVRVSEGNAGMTTATFVVRLSGAPAGPMGVHFATADGSAAVAGDDYVPTQGDLVFNGGDTEQRVTVQVAGDFDVEGDEQFFLNLSNATGGALIGDAQAIGTIANDDAPLPAPAVTQVFVSSGAWTPAFRNFLAAQGLGDPAFGYAVPAGAAQLGVLPWGNVDRVSIRFNTDVLAVDRDLAVRGTRTTSYAVSDFDYDDATHTATWTLAQPVTNDRLLLDLSGGADGIVNPQAVALDGEWANGSDAYPSGDGTAGGSLRFRLNVLGGDVTRDGRVTYFDWLELRRRRLHTAANPGTGATAYGAFFDAEGDGSIGTPDLLVVRRNLLRGLPLTEPAGSVASAASVRAARFTSITDEIFGSVPVSGV